MEFIICAAVKVEETGKIYYGHRHCHCMEAANGELSWDKSRKEICELKIIEGFITSENRFVEREEAYIIAEKNNQIKTIPHNIGRLFSEDLY